MKPLTLEWVRKAEGDYEVMEREARARSRRVHDSVCFHAQQCAEKYLKARLYEANISFQPIHKLLALLDQTLVVEPLWEAHREDLAYLSNFAVAFRYPGESATRAQALAARALPTLPFSRSRRFGSGIATQTRLAPESQMSAPQTSRTDAKPEKSNLSDGWRWVLSQERI